MLATSLNVPQAIRRLVRSPAFAVTAVVTLAIGIGANTAVFSAIYSVLLTPLPFPEPDRLVHISERDEDGFARSVAPVRLHDWATRTEAFASISGYYTGDVSDTTGDVPERVKRAVVAPQFVETWGVAPLLGRGFTEQEHAWGGPSAVLISESYWRQRLNADPGVLERQIRIENSSLRVVGVMPASFRFPDADVQLWMPHAVDAPFAQSRELQWYTAIGRLQPGQSPAQGLADLTRVQAQLAEEYPDSDAGLRVQVTPLKEFLVGDVSESMWLLFIAVCILLLITCFNIVSLVLSRTLERRRDIVVRYSLGASRFAVILQLVTEVALLAFGGAILGIVAAVMVSSSIRRLVPHLPRLDEMSWHPLIFLYMLAVTVLVAILCSVIPALRVSRENQSLKLDGRGNVSSGGSAQWLLVAMQVALSVALLAGAGLLVRTSSEISRVDPGFDSSGILAFRVSGSYDEPGGYDRIVQRINTTIDELRVLPGVEEVATSRWLPGASSQDQTEYRLVEARSDRELTMSAERRIVSPSYFEVMRIALLEGSLCERPQRGDISQVMVNRSFVDRYLGGRNPVGLHLDAGTPDRIVGVVGDARELGTNKEPVPTVYPCLAAPIATPWFLVRTTAQPLSMAPAIRAKLAELEPLRSVYDVATLEERISDTYAQSRLHTILLITFSVAALVLSCLGVYGTLSCLVNARTREVGLRMAIGARRGHIAWHFLAKALRVVGVSSLGGLALAYVFTQTLAGMLYGVTPSDSATLVSVVAVVVIAASMAALIPAVRAALMEPMRVLRDE